MKKKLTKNNLSRISKDKPVKKILFSANFFFLLILFGFLLTTNSNPEIFYKYTFSYLARLLFLLILIIPYNILIIFLLSDSISVNIYKKNYKLNFAWRIFIIFLTAVLVILVSELFLRMKPKPFVENFHPFLQFITTKKNENNLHVNSDNFRYDELTEVKPENTYRIFVLGGSTVFDKDRSYEKSITKQVENLLLKKYPEKKIQVINAGYERYTSEHSLILYQTKIADYDPDLIIIWQGFNDMYYSCTPDFSPIQEYKNDYSHFYQVLSNPIDNYFNWKIRFISLDRIIKAFTENFYSDIRTQLPQPEKKIAYTDDIEFKSLNAYKRNMEYIAKSAKADDVKIIIGNQPNHYDDNPENYGLMQYFCKKNNNLLISIPAINSGMKMFNDASREIAEKYQVPFIDLEGALPKNPNYLTDDVHYTDLGAKKVAETIYEAVLNSKYLEN